VLLQGNRRNAEVEAGQYENAKTLVTSLLKQQDRAELHSILGNAEAAQKNYKAAAVEYQKAAEMDPSETRIFDFGMSLFHLDHNAAITILRYGMQEYPGSIKLHVALGTVLYADGKSLEGAQLLCEAEELNPSDPHPMELLAETEIVPPELAPRIISLFADLHKRYEHDGLILYDYTMVQSGRWSRSTDPPPPHFEYKSVSRVTARDEPPAWARERASARFLLHSCSAVGLAAEGEAD